MDNVTLNDMMRQIQTWHSEAVNARNDGWTQQAYRDRLETLHARLAAVVEAISPQRQTENNRE